MSEEARVLRFLYLTTFYPPYSFGGDAIYLYRVATALAELGHEVDVVHSVDAFHLQHPSEPVHRFQDHPLVRRHELRGAPGWLSPLAAHQTGSPLPDARRIQAIFASKPWDVVHYHNISLLGPRVLTYTPAGHNWVKLYTTHEHWLVCPMHVLWKYGERACDKPDCLRCTIQGRRPPQLWRHTGLLRRAGAHIDRYLSPSRFTAHMHAERGFPYPVEVLPYFLDRCDDDWRNPGPAPHPRPYFLFVGRLEKIKGLETLIHAWRSISAYDLLVAGSGADEIPLRALAAANPRIRFLGPQSQADLASLYAHARATIVPSVTYETFGIIMIESFARKTPVIVRNLGALPEVVRASGGGLVFSNDLELAAAIDNIGSQPAHRNQLGESGYAAFLKHWTRQAHLESYARHIDQARLHRYGAPQPCALA